MTEDLICIGANNCPDERCPMVQDYIKNWGRGMWETQRSHEGNEHGCGRMDKEPERNVKTVTRDHAPVSNAGMRFKKK